MTKGERTRNGNNGAMMDGTNQDRGPSGNQKRNVKTTTALVT